MPNRQMTLKPSIHRKCSIAMCQNSTVNSISRTAAPANASFFMCDACLLEAVTLRFGKSYVGQAIEIDMRIADLQTRVATLTAEAGKRVTKAETAADEAETPVKETKKASK